MYVEIYLTLLILVVKAYLTLSYKSSEMCFLEAYIQN